MTAAILRELMAAGLAGEALLAAVERIEAAGLSTGLSTGIPVDTAAEKRRAYDRERKRTKRNSTGLSTGIPPDAESALPLSSLTKKVRKKERAIGEKCPPDFGPSEVHFAECEKLGRPPQFAHQCSDDLRLWARSNEHRAVARKSDWDAALLSWIRREHGKLKPGNPAIAPPAKQSAQELADLEIINRRIYGPLQKPSDGGDPAGVVERSGDVSKLLRQSTSALRRTG